MSDDSDASDALMREIMKLCRGHPPYSTMTALTFACALVIHQATPEDHDTAIDILNTQIRRVLTALRTGNLVTPTEH